MLQNITIYKRTQFDISPQLEATGCSINSITATQYAGVLFRSLSATFKSHNKIDSLFSKHLILVVNQELCVDLAGKKAHSRDDYNAAFEINANDVFEAKSDYYICLLPKDLLKTNLNSVGGNATGTTEIKMAAVGCIVGQTHISTILKNKPFTGIFKG